jgi:hypothetical protein
MDLGKIVRVIEVPEIVPTERPLPAENWPLPAKDWPVRAPIKVPETVPAEAD